MGACSVRVPVPDPSISRSEEPLEISGSSYHTVTRLQSLVLTILVDRVGNTIRCRAGES